MQDRIFIPMVVLDKVGFRHNTPTVVKDFTEGPPGDFKFERYVEKKRDLFETTLTKDLPAYNVLVIADERLAGKRKDELTAYIRFYGSLLEKNKYEIYVWNGTGLTPVKTSKQLEVAIRLIPPETVEKAKVIELAAQPEFENGQVIRPAIASNSIDVITSQRSREVVYKILLNFEALYYKLNLREFMNGFNMPLAPDIVDFNEFASMDSDSFLHHLNNYDDPTKVTGFALPNNSYSQLQNYLEQFTKRFPHATCMVLQQGWSQEHSSNAKALHQLVLNQKKLFAHISEVRLYCWRGEDLKEWVQIITAQLEKFFPQIKTVSLDECWIRRFTYCDGFTAQSGDNVYSLLIKDHPLLQAALPQVKVVFKEDLGPKGSHFPKHDVDLDDGFSLSTQDHASLEAKNAEAIAKFLNQFGLIQSLDLVQCDLTGLEKYSLPILADLTHFSFHIYETQCSENDLTTLLNAMPNLRFCHLPGIKLQASPQKKTIAVKPKLEELHLRLACSENYLFNLFNVCTQIKSIDLNMVKVSKTHSTVKLNPLVALVDLTISSGQYEGETLSHIFNAAAGSVRLMILNQLRSNESQSPKVTEKFKRLNNLYLDEMSATMRDAKWQLGWDLLERINPESLRRLEFSTERPRAGIPSLLRPFQHLHEFHLDAPLDRGSLAQLQAEFPRGSISISYGQRKAESQSQGNGSATANPSLDGDTKNNPNQTIRTQQVFITKNSKLSHPALVREKVYNRVKMDEKEITLAVGKCRYEPLDLKPYLKPAMRDWFEEQDDDTLGYSEFRLQEINHWYTLASISAMDELKAVEHNISELVENGTLIARRNLDLDTIEICITKEIVEERLNQFRYVMSLHLEIYPAPKPLSKTAKPLFRAIEFKAETDPKSGKPITNFRLVAANQHEHQQLVTKLQHYQQNRSEALHDMVQYGSAFDDTIDLQDLSHAKGYDLLNAVNKKSAGVCRHRTMVFATQAPLFQLEWRATEKPGLHLEIEIKDPTTKRWKKAGLGGGYAKLEVQKLESTAKSNKEMKVSAATERKPLIPALPPLPTHSLDDFFATLLQLMLSFEAHERQVNLIFNNADEIFAFNVALHDWLVMKGKRGRYVDDLADAKEKTMQSDTLLRKFLLEAESHLKDLPPQVLALQNDFVLSMHWSDLVVGFNSVVDQNRFLGDTRIADGVCVIVAMTKQTFRKTREDHRRRFRAIIEIPIALKLPTDIIFAQDDEKATSSLKPWSKDLHHTTKWSRILKGYFNVSQDRVHYENPEWVELFKRGAISGLVARNLPLNDRQCRYFWVMELQRYRSFETGETVFTLPAGRGKLLKPETPAGAGQAPANFTLQWQQQHYSFNPEHFSVTLLPPNTEPDADYVLHSGNFSSFSQSWEWTSEKGLNTTMPGWIETFPGKVIKLLAVNKITLGQCEELAEECEKHGKKVEIIDVDGEQLPESVRPKSQAKEDKDKPQPLKDKKPAILADKDLKDICSHGPAVIVTNDPDFVWTRLQQQTKVDYFFRINSTMKSELIELWTRSSDAKSGASKEFQFQGTLQPGVVLSHLRAGKSVVILGTLSDALKNQLSSYFVKKYYSSFNGKKETSERTQLCIITDKMDFAFSPRCHRYPVHEKHYWSELTDEFSKTHASLIKRLCTEFQVSITSITQLKSMFHALKTRPDRNPIEPWILMTHPHPAEAVQKARQFYETCRPALVGAAPEVKQKVNDELLHPEVVTRLNDTHELWQQFPVVFWMGPSGTGKSSIVANDLNWYYAQRGVQTRIFQRLEDIPKAAEPADPNAVTILFLDEANIIATSDGYDIFAEGCAAKLKVNKDKKDTEPQQWSLLHNGVEYKLPNKNFYVLGACNYFGYQNRKVPNLLSQYGLVYHFLPFSKECIIETQVTPLLKVLAPDLKNHMDMDKMATFFYDVYEHVQKNCKQRLITPRNLQAMVLLTAALWKKHHEKYQKDPMLIARWASYQIAYDFLNDEQRQTLKIQLFNQEDIFTACKQDLQFDVSHLDLDDLVINTSNERVLHMASDEIDMHNLRLEVLSDLRIKLKSLLENNSQLKSKYANELKDPQFMKHGLSDRVVNDLMKEPVTRLWVRQYLLVAGCATRGMLVEGPPGTGKSSMLNKFLVKRGIFFDRIPFTDVPKMQKRQTNNFHTGQQSFVDERNTGPLEKTENSIMMGRRDEEGNATEHEGYYNWTTQNTADFGGRIADSPAQENRFRKVLMPKYTPEQMIAIAVKKGITPELASRLVDEYLLLEETQTIKPTLTEFLRWVRDIKSGKIVIERPDVSSSARASAARL